MFKIKDKLFNIKHAYIDAFISTNNQLIFGLQIKATDKDKVLNSEYTDISDSLLPDELWFNSELLLKINSNEIQKWQDIVGQKIEWKDYPQNEEEEPHALFYVYEHTGIYNAKIEFKNIEKKVVVNIKASCDIYAGEEFYDNLPLEIETEVDFFGIFCGKEDEEQCRNKIKPFLNLDNLKFVQNKYQVSLMVPKDSNFETNLLVLGNY